jgi:hypothetical protein
VLHEPRISGGVGLFASGGERDPQGLRKTTDVELRHQIGAVDLDRSRADAEVVGNGLVGKTLRKTIEHVAFTRRKRLQPNFRVGPSLASCFLLRQPSKAFVDRLEQGLEDHP